MPDRANSTNLPVFLAHEALLAGIQHLNGRTAAIQRDLRTLMQSAGDDLIPAAEQLVEHLISFLDEVDGDVDLEDNADAEPDEDGEPSLGSFDCQMNQEQWGPRGGLGEWDVDLEHDTADDEDNGDAEPDATDLPASFFPGPCIAAKTTNAYGTGTEEPLTV